MIQRLQHAGLHLRTNQRTRFIEIWGSRLPEVGDEMEAENMPAKRRSRAKKVRLLTLDDLDDRTRAAQVVREMRGEIIADLGGETNLSTLERSAVDHVALTAGMIRDVARRCQGQRLER